ncbi:hypothetical protein ACWERY_28510 [Streptomyces sp. NPDC004082]|uniref:hypothetical protein n=1 Tax=unclassified Streptomyces TaxID=2593676 RepID=UPI0033A0196A
MSRHDERRPEHDHDHSHAGNGTVNYGPEEQGPEGLGSDELALRRLLHSAVEEIEPTDGTLDHLRRAVPARRARKRQAVVGMAAAALFIGTAVPALVHVSNSNGSNANPSVVGNSQETQGGVGQSKGQDSGSGGSGGSAGTSKDKNKQGKGKQDKGKAGAGATSGADPSAPVVGDAPCTAAQLGANGSAGSPDSTGVVYGSFSVSNVSGVPCTVTGPGTVGASALGAADPGKVTAVRHVAGDAASGLPDPSQEQAALLLKPGTSYVVKFAWVPSQTCPPAGGGDPSPDPTPSGGTGDSGGGTSTDSGVSTQLVREDTVDGSVAVGYTASGGAPSASTVVANACSGTVYWTGLLAGS